MIDSHSQSAAEEFVRCLQSLQPVKDFQDAEVVFQNHPEVRKLREQFAAMAQEFQEKQTRGTLTQEDITLIRNIQLRLNTHPITKQYAQAQQAMVLLLQDCNATMSEMLGFDFAATAAPTASC